MKTFLILQVLLLSVLVRAQEVSFVVYHTKGQSTANGKPLALKKGDKLYSSDVLTIGKGASLVLLCGNYEAFQLSAPGKHPVKSLLQKCSKKAGSYTASYFQYVWEEFTHPHGSPEKDPTKYMRNSGAVSRGCDQVETRLPLDTVIFAAGSLPVFFRSAISQPYLTVFSAPEDGEVLQQFAVRDNSFALDTLQKTFKKPGSYFWQLTDVDAMGCPTNVFKILPEKAYRAAVQKILQSLPSVSPAETAFLKGYLLEEAHFLAEAKKYYQLAAQMDPSNQNYQFAKSRFYE